MDVLQVIHAQLKQARSNQADAAFNEDYVEAGLQSIRIEALEDVLTEAAINNQHDNVVNLHG